MSLVSKNAEFAELFRYHTAMENNSLKKMQSLVAVACRLIRIFYAILIKRSGLRGDVPADSIVQRDGGCESCSHETRQNSTDNARWKAPGQEAGQ